MQCVDKVIVQKLAYIHTSLRTASSALNHLDDRVWANEFVSRYIIYYIYSYLQPFGCNCRLGATVDTSRLPKLVNCGPRNNWQVTTQFVTIYYEQQHSHLHSAVKLYENGPKCGILSMFVKFGPKMAKIRGAQLLLPRVECQEKKTGQHRVRAVVKNGYNDKDITNSCLECAFIFQNGEKEGVLNTLWPEGEFYSCQYNNRQVLITSAIMPISRSSTFCPKPL